MKISLTEWLRLGKSLAKVQLEIADMYECVADMVCRHKSGEERAAVQKVLAHIDEAASELSRLDVQPQSEWLGGEDGPTALREPHFVGLNPRHFTQDEIDEAKKAGLLNGQYVGGFRHD